MTEKMTEYKLIFDDGDFTYVNIYMTDDEAKEHYLGNTFNVGIGEEDVSKTCVKIVNLDIADVTKGLTRTQKEKISDNLKAYKANFGYIRIEKDDYGKGFYVYNSPEPEASYVQYCCNIDYLNGWLYGAVQANNHVIESIR